MKCVLFFILSLASLGVWANDAGLVSAPHINFLSDRDDESKDSWPFWPLFIHFEELKTNPKASYCTRPVEMIDTIVLHHTETFPTTTIQEVNNFHLSRGSEDDPWYMIAYSYVINSPYSGESLPKIRITQGRPLEMVGAHAGSNAFLEMDKTQKKMWDEKKILCGKENEQATLNPLLLKDGKIKANVTTIGVAIIGNYSPFSITSPTGYSKNNPRYPTKETLEVIAKLSCQLQRKHSRIKHIKWHSYYNQTSCPGTIKDSVEQIRILAKRYGCVFN